MLAQCQEGKTAPLCGFNTNSSGREGLTQCPCLLLSPSGRGKCCAVRSSVYKELQNSSLLKWRYTALFRFDSMPTISLVCTTSSLLRCRGELSQSLLLVQDSGEHRPVADAAPTLWVLFSQKKFCQFRTMDSSSHSRWQLSAQRSCPSTQQRTSLPDHLLRLYFYSVPPPGL